MGNFGSLLYPSGLHLGKQNFFVPFSEDQSNTLSGKLTSTRSKETTK